MLTCVILFILICAGSSMMAGICNKRFEETMAFFLMSIVILLYMGGILNCLQLFWWIAVGICIILWMITLIHIVKNRQKFIRNFFTPAFILFAFIYFLFFIVQKNLLLLNWDEFSHWGFTAKSTFYFNRLGSLPGSQVMFKDYPPGAALFEYFWTKLTGFREGSLITSYSTLLVSMLIIGMRGINWKNLSRLFIYALLILPIPIIFYANAYSSVLIDPMLGVSFAYGMASLFFEEKFDLFVSVRTGFVCAFLLLLKSTGILSVFFILIFAVIDCLMKKKEQKSCLGLPMFLLFFIPIMVQISWKIHLKINNITSTFKISEVSPDKILASFTGNGPEYHKNVLIAFVEEILNKPVTTNFIPMTLWTYIALFILLSGIIIRFTPSSYERKRFFIMMLVMAVYGAIYLASLLAMYLFVFNEGQARMLVSFVRYTNVYHLSLLLFLMLTAFHYTKGNLNNYDLKLGIVSCFMCGVIAFAQVGNAFTAMVPAKEVANRKTILQNIEMVKKHTTVNDKLCLILQNTSGKDYFIIKYSLFPRYSDSYGSFSIGEKYSANDYYTMPMTPKEWRNGLLLRGFTHVYLYKADEKFFQQYGSLFYDVENAKESQLFRINPSAEAFLLEAVD